MATLKLSQISPALSAPATTDELVGVAGGTTDNLFTLSQIATSVLNTVGLAVGSAKITGGTPGQLLYDNAGAVGEIPQAQVTDPLMVSVIRSAPWDDFDVTDGTALNGRLTPSGHTWAVSGAGQATAIVNGQGYVNTAQNNAYAYLTDSQNISIIECVVSWTLVSGQVDTHGTSGVMAFADSSGSLQKMLHLQFHPDGWNLLKTTTGAGGLVPLSGTPVELNGTSATTGSWYGGFLRVDGTRYKIRMVANTSANTLTIYFPDGVVWRWTDTDISTIVAATAFWEHDGNGAAGYADLRFNGCSIGPSKAGSVIEPNTTKDTALLRGIFNSFSSWSSQISVPQSIVKTTNGWYTIAQQSADTPTPKMAGRVTVWGADASDTHCLFDLTVGAEASSGIGAQNIFTATPMLGAWNLGIVDQVRLSGDMSNGLINLDIHINNSANVTLYAQYRGMFAPVTTPVVGATVLTSWNSVLNTLTFASQVAPQQWNPTDKSSTMNVTGQNLIATANASAEAQVRSTTSHAVGKFYAELTPTVLNGASASFGFGMASASHLFTTYLGNTESPPMSFGYWSDGSVLLNHASLVAANVNTAFSANKVLALAIDLINYKLWVKNITAGTNWNNDAAANPSTGTNGLDISSLGNAPFFLAVDIEHSGDSGTLNAGSSAFSGTLPTGGFVAWG